MQSRFYRRPQVGVSSGKPPLRDFSPSTAADHDCCSRLPCRAGGRGLRACRHYRRPLGSLARPLGHGRLERGFGESSTPPDSAPPCERTGPHTKHFPDQLRLTTFPRERVLRPGQPRLAGTSFFTAAGLPLRRSRGNADFPLKGGSAHGISFPIRVENVPRGNTSDTEDLRP